MENWTMSSLAIANLLSIVFLAGSAYWFTKKQTSKLFRPRKKTI